MPLPAKDIVPLGLDTPQVLMHAFRTCPFGELARRLPPPQIRMRRLPACHDLAADLPLTALEDRLLLEVDGVATLQELAARAPEGVEPVLRAAGALLSIGLIEGFLGAARPMASAPPVASSAEDQVPPITARLGAPSPSRPGGFDGGDESFGSAEPATSTAVDDDMDWEDSPSEIGAPETPAIAAETSFLALDAHVAGAAPPSDDGLPLHDGSWEMPAGWAEAPPPTDGGHATQRSTQGAAVAVAEAPRLETGVDLHALAAFLLELAATLRQHPSAVPEHVRVLLPPDVRSRFGL